MTVPAEYRCAREARCAEGEKTEQRPTVCDECDCHAGYGRPCTVPGGCGHLHKPVTVRIGGRIVTERGLCITCERIITEAIAALPRDYVELHLALQRGSAGINEFVAASKDLPAALRVNVAALAAEMVRLAVVWIEPVAEKLGVDWDSQRMERNARPGYVLQRAAGLLSKRLPVLLALRGVDIETWSDNGWYHTHEPADGLDGALALLRLHEITRAALGQNKLVHHLPAPCPNCDRMGLVRDNGDDNVHCRFCRIVWGEDDYRRLTLVVANDIKAATG